MIYKELKAKIHHLPAEYAKYKPVLDAMDQEQIHNIILDNGVFWFEYPKNNTVTNEQHDLLVAYLKQKGFKYLHERKVGNKR
jgi:hypothetical protein